MSYCEAPSSHELSSAKHLYLGSLVKDETQLLITIADYAMPTSRIIRVVVRTKRNYISKPHYDNCIPRNGNRFPPNGN